MNWTNEQKDAIYDAGGTLLVSAAAGSGKTAVLAERAALILADEDKNVAADKLLIVTFTRAAAAELRARIAARLSVMQAENPANVYLRRQRLLLGRSNIGTVDSFCLKLIKQYFDVLNVPPDIEMGTDEKLRAIKSDVMAAVLEKMYSDADFCEFASLYGRSRDDDTALNALERLCGFLESVPFEQKTLNQMCKDYEGEESLAQTIWGKRLISKAATLVETALKYENTAKNIIIEEELLAKKLPAIESDIAFLKKLAILIENENWDDIIIALQSFSPEKLSQTRGADGDAVDTIKALRKNAKDIIDTIKEKIFVCSELEFCEDRKKTLPLITALCKAAQMFRTEYFKAKIEQKIIDFSDAEHLALSLLCKDTGEKTLLCAKISTQFDAVMVDEYQDTNALQSLLYFCLANEQKSNLFFVGDIKQSIYRFRLARPEIFMGQKDSYYEYNGKDYPAVINLGANFRSSKNVINGINHIFDSVMSREVGGVNYTEDEKLYNGTISDYDGGACELVILDKEDSQDNSEVKYICKRIKEMVKNKYQIRQKDGNVRDCTWGDFCILLRTRSDFAIFEAEICAQGIPVYTDTKESLLSRKEISPLVSLLRIIDNPTLDIHVAAVALSLLYSITPAQIAKAKKGNRDGLYIALQKDTSPEIAKFCEDLAQFRRTIAVSSIQELFAQVFSFTQYFSAVGAYKNGTKMRDNIRVFVDYADKTIKAVGGLSAFLRMIDFAPDKAGSDGTESASANRTSVNVMTIHRSKGLEFPVCFVARCHRKFYISEAKLPVLYHAELGAAFTLKSQAGVLYRSAVYRAVLAAIKEENISEEMRVLYVALTRAQNKLIITSVIKDAGKGIRETAVLTAAIGSADKALIARASSYMTWLYTASVLAQRCELQEYAKGLIVPFTYQGTDFDGKIVACEDVGEDADIQETPCMSMPDEELANELLQGFASSKNKKENTIQVPIKMSVSQIIGKDIQKILQKPDFSYQAGATGGMIGTAMHEFAQLANLKTLPQAVNKEIKRLIDEKFITAETASLLDEEKLKLFLCSNVWKRMNEAQNLYREYDFITSIDATKICGEGANGKKILVQGIADVIIVNNGEAEIIDYKTDKVSNMQLLVQRYKSQLLLYKTAIEKQLAVNVAACTIYSFELDSEIKI